MSPFRVAIIGAGPAGCTLARLLHLANIEVTIFEAESSINVRSQGGTLDLSPRTGIAVLKATGLYEEYLKFCRFDGSSLGLCDKKAHFYFRIGASSSAGNPEIDRVELRSLLVRSLPEGTVRWNHRLRMIDENLVLHFDESTETGFDLVVGAEGAWSKVRNFLSTEKPFFSGVAGYSLSIPNAADTTPEISEFVNRGSVFAYSDGKAITAQQMGDNSILVSVWLRQEEDPSSSVSNIVPPTKEEICKAFDDWSPELLRIIQATAGEITCRSLYMLPVGFRWAHTAGMTLLGDSAHLMTPFAGIGVNIALSDAMKLANAVIDATKDGKPGALDSRITAFEEDMFVRAHKAMSLTDGMMRDMLFTEGAPKSTVGSWALKKAAYEIPPLLYPLLYPLVFVGLHGYLFYKRFAL